MLNKYSSLKNVFLKSLLFYFSSITLIFPNECDDDSAINFNPNSDDTIDCVYVKNIPTINADEDTEASIDLNGYIDYDNPPDNLALIDNVSFEVECNNIYGIENNGCYIDEDNYLYVTLVEDFDTQTGFFDIIITYNDNSNIEFEPKTDSCSVFVNAINDPPIITTDNINLEAVNGNMFELYIEVDDPDDYGKQEER